MRLMRKRPFDSRCASELLSNHYSPFHLPGSYQLAEDVIASFQGFLAETDADKNLWTFLGSDGKPSDGYVRRDGKVAPYEAHTSASRQDSKSWWHWSPRMPEFLDQRGLSETHQDLYAASQNLWQFSQDVCVDALRVLDQVMSGRQLAMLGTHPSSQRLSTLRLIVYDPVEPEEDLADWHADRSDLSLHIANSRPALRVGPQRLLWEGGPDDVLLFTGTKARTSLDLWPLKHGATEGSVSCAAAQVPRWTAVFFFHINHALYQR